MVTITQYVRQQKRHRCIERCFGLCGRRRGQDDMGEWHWNMYNIIYEMNCLSRLDAWYKMLGAGALRWPRGMVWGGRWEGGSGWGTCVHPWWIHVAKSLQSCPTLCDPIDSSPPGSPSLGVSGQEHWSGLSFPSPMHESEKWKWSPSVVSNS